MNKVSMILHDSNLLATPIPSKTLTLWKACQTHSLDKSS